MVVGFTTYLCNHCLSPLTLTLWVWKTRDLELTMQSPLASWVRIQLRRGVLDTTLCDKVCPRLTVGRWFSLVFSSNKTYHYDITELLLNTITPPQFTCIILQHLVITPPQFTCIILQHLVITPPQFTCIILQHLVIITCWLFYINVFSRYWDLIITES